MLPHGAAWQDSWFILSSSFMKRFIILNICTLLTLLSSAQVYYSYAPSAPADSELAALGGNTNGFVQGLTLFDPSEDPAFARLKGKTIKGVRCYMRADYKQARQSRSGILASIDSPNNFVRTTYADLLQGWNDILFDEPLLITGDEKIYLGVQAYETVGTPYPLGVYSPATVPNSCLVNLGKKGWETYTDRGTLLLGAILDDDTAPLLARTAYAQNTTHPQTVAPESDFEGGLYVHNFSDEPLASADIAMTGEGSESPTVRTITFPSPIPAYGSTVIDTQLRAGAAEGTSVTWTAGITAFNGNPAQAGRPGRTTLYVTYDNFIRTPLVEEFTSQLCVNCPSMAYFLDKALESFDQPYVYLSHHSGFREDAFTSEADRALTYIFGGYENEYNPAIMYNRAVLEGENTVIQGVRSMDSTPYFNALSEAAAMPAMAEITVEKNGSTIVASGRVARDLAETPLRLSLHLVEDGIGTERYRQTGLDDPDAPADLSATFCHNGVILHTYNADPLGDLLDIDTANGTFHVSYPDVTATRFGGTALRIVAIVHQVDKNNLRRNQALNAAQLWLEHTGIGQLRTTEHDSSVFDLQGRRLRKAQKGICIQNGKKVVR